MSANISGPINTPLVGSLQLMEVLQLHPYNASKGLILDDS